MMNGEIWWVDFQEPRGSTPAFVRPGIIVQNNELNNSELNSTILQYSKFVSPKIFFNDFLKGRARNI